MTFLFIQFLPTGSREEPDLLSIFEYTNFPQTEAKALYKLDKPLDALYQEWLHNDLSYMDLLRDTIDNRIESAVRELKAKSRDSR